QTQQRFDFFANMAGITSQTVTREQFKEAMTKMRERFTGMAAGGAPGGGMGASGAAGGGTGTFTRPGGPGGGTGGSTGATPGAATAPAETSPAPRGPGGGGFDPDARAEGFVRLVDKDGDGQLNA